MQREQLKTGSASRLQANAVNGVGKTPTAWLCRFLALSVASASLSVFADNAAPVPSYLQPLMAMASDSSWASPMASVSNPNSGKVPVDQPLNILVDGGQEIDVVADPMAAEALSKLDLIEIAVPMPTKRYVFTSMQSLLDFMLATDMVLVQSMVEDEYEKVHPKNAKSANALIEGEAFSDGDATNELTSREDSAFHANGIASRPMSAVAAASDSVTARSAKPPLSSPKYRTAAGWETDESVWIMNYHYLPGCGYVSVVSAGPCTPYPVPPNIACRGAHYSRDVRWNPMCWYGDTQFWGGYDDSDVVTAFNAAYGFTVEEEHVHAYYATIGGPYESRNVCETYGWFFGSYCSSWWRHGPRAVVMGRFADLVLARDAGVRTVGQPNDQQLPYFSLLYPGVRVLIKSPQFWSFCSVFPKCGNAFGLPVPRELGYTMLPWQGFDLIPDARNTYFAENYGLTDYPEITYIEVTTYRERTTEAGLAQLTDPRGSALNGQGMAALMEASSGCDVAIMPPRYTDTEMMPAHTFDRGSYCAVPRKRDGSPLLHVKDRSLATTAAPDGVDVSVFFADQSCLNNAPPIAPDPAAWEAACYRSRNACSLIDLANRTRYNMDELSGPPSTGDHFNRCRNLYRGPHNIPQ